MGASSKQDHLHELVTRVQVSKTMKVLNIADEFLVHVFKARIIVSSFT